MPEITSLDAWRRPRRLALAKTLALMVSLCFLWPYVAFAFEPATYPRDLVEEFRYVPLTANGQTLDIKSDWGRVTSSYRGTSGKTVVFIQDLHCNYEVQSNIQAMLAKLAKTNQLRLVGVEGESTPVDVGKLAKIPLAPVKDKVGQYFLRRGRITGPEYQAATGDDPLQLQGVESQALYDHNQNTLLKFLNEESQGYCQDLRFALEQLKRPVYNTDLAKMDHERENYDQENQTLEKYCDFLLAEASRLGVELEPFKVIRLYALEHRLPVNAVVDYERLLHEAEALDRAIRQRLYTSDEQRRLDQQLYVLKITENLINISATEEDLRYFRGHREEFTLEPMLHFLEEVSYRYALQPDLDPGVLKLVEYLGQAAEFYRVADQRSQAFVENLLQAMKKRRESLAVLITGGFHASHVENALRAQGISFLTVKPRLTRTDVANPYFSLLRNERTPLEKLLARNENIFAPRSLFNSPVFQRYLETVWEIELGRKLVLEDKLSGEALQQAFRAARGQYPADDAQVNLVFRPEQSNPANNVYVFQFEQESGYYVVVRPNATTAYTTEIGGEVLYGNNFQFQFVAAEEFAQKRADITGLKAPGRAGVLAVSGLAARLAEVTNPARRVLGALAIALGAPQGLRGLTPAALWSFIVARMNAFFRPNDNLIEKAMAWSLDQYDYQANRVSRLPFRLDLEYILSLAQSDEKVRKFIGRDPGRLALAGMAFHNARQPLTGETTPTQNLEALIASFEEAESIAQQILAGTPLEQIQIKVGLSRLAQYIQMIREGRGDFDFNADQPMNLALILPENISKLQTRALAQLQARNKVKMNDSHPLEAFRLLHLSAEKVGAKLSQLGEQEGVQFAFAAVSAETAMSAVVAEETAAEEEIARPPLIQLGLAPLETGAGEEETLTRIMDSATPLSQVTNGAQRQTVLDGLRLLGFQVRADGKVMLTASRQVARVQAARRTLEREQQAMNRRLNFLTRLNAPTPAQQQERFELLQQLSKFKDAVFELGEILTTFRSGGDKVFSVLLSDQMDVQAHGHAFSIVNGDRMVLNANALNQMNSGRNRMQLMRRLAHEAGHIAGLEQTRIGEIRAGLIAKILAGYQLGIADYTAEIGKVGRRAILGEEAAEARPASEIALTDGQRETMESWFGERGWTQVAIDTFASFTGALTAEQLDALVPGTATDPAHQSGVKLLAQVSQALAAADSGLYTGADLLDVFKLTLRGLTLNAAVNKHAADQQAYAREAVPAEFAAFETARTPIRNADQVRQLVGLAFPGEEGLALTPALRLMSERIAAEEAAQFTDVNYAIEFYLDFDARAAGVVKGLPAALQPQARQYLMAALDKALASQRGTASLLVEKKVQKLLQTPEEAVAALRDFARFFRVNFQSAIFANQSDLIHVNVRRRGQELLRQTAEQQAVGVFGNKAPPTKADLTRLLPPNYPAETLFTKLTTDAKFRQAFSQYTSQVIWYLGRGTQAIGYVPALNQLIQAGKTAESQREAIRTRMQQALEQIAWFFDDAAWPEVEQMVYAAYRAQYVQDLAQRLVVEPEAVSSARMLASEAPLAAEFNVLAEELAALRQSQGGLNASFSRLAAAVHQQANAPLQQKPVLALVGPKGAGRRAAEAGAEQTLLMNNVRQSFNTALKKFQTGDYQRARLIELLDEADQQMAALVSRYGDDPVVLALEGNLAEQRRLLVQALNLNDFARRNPTFQQSLNRLLQEVSQGTETVRISSYITYALSGGQIVSRSGLAHATYSNPNGDNIQQAQFAGYMRLASVNGQLVLCVDDGSRHFSRPGFNGQEKQFLSSIRGLKPVLMAMGVNKVAYVSGYAAQSMTAFDPSKIVNVEDVASGKVRASKDIGGTVEIENYESVAARVADLRAENPAAHVDYIHSQAGAVANALRPFLADAADADAVEKYLLGLTPATLQVNTTERISGALAVHRALGGQVKIIAERQLEGDLRNSTVLHEVVEAALRDRGVAEAHALAFVVEQELASESLRAKLNQPEHYDEAHLRNLVANTENVINAIDREPGGTAALKQRQKDNALLVARIARSVLQERQRVHALALDQRGFFGEETQAALVSLFTQFLNSQEELRSRLVKQLAVGNTFQMIRVLVQRGFDVLSQEELDAFFAFFGHKVEVRAGLFTRQMLSNEIRRLRRSLQGTMFEETLNQAQIAVQSLEDGQPLTVKVNGQERQIVDLQIRKITAKEAVSPTALKVGAFFTVEETPAGAVGYVNVMAHRQMPQATLHELLETVLGIDHRLVADLEAVSEYSLGKMPFFQALTRELFWPTRLLSSIVGIIGLVGVALAVGLIFFGTAPAAIIPVMIAGVMPLAWSSATYFKQRFVITVDGPDATGKTEIGEVLSRYYGYTYADAAMYYRAFALIVKDEIDSGNWTEEAFRAETPAEQQAFATFTKIVVDRLQQADVNMFFDRSLRERRMRVFLREGGFPGRRREITDQVLPAAATASSAEFQRVEALASQLGQIPAVQRVVDEHLRALAKRENLVAVGQTMGTKLFDRDAQMRFYVVNNDLRNRAERLLRRPLRTEQELAAGLAEIEHMDLSARTRQRDPLRPIPDAVVLDTGNFALADVLKTARQSIARRSEVIRNAFTWIASLVRDRHRMLNRIQGETARRQVLEQMGDAWLGFSDIDGLSGYNLIYGKAITNYLLDDVLSIIEETANSRPVRQIVDRNRRVFRQMLGRALVTLNFRQAFQLIMQLAETRVTTIKHGGDEGLYLIPEFFSPRDVGEIMKQFRSRVQLFMHRQFKPYEVLGLKPAEEQELRAIAAKINEDYGDPKLVRVAFDEVYGVRVLLRVGRSDLAKRFQQELRGFAPLAEGQINGNLVELVLKKRLEEAGLQAAQVENLNLTQLAWPQVAEGFKPPLDQKGYGYLQEGYLLTPTLSIGATKASRVDYAYVEKHEAGALTRSDVQAWSEALYQLAGDFLHQAKDAGKNQVVVDQLQEPIRREEKAPEAPVLGPTHSRQLERQQLLFEDNLVLRTGERPKHDAIYPKHFSTDGFRELVRQRLAVLAGRSDFQPEIHVSRAPPDSGPDKVHIAVITPETTYLLELEGQYYGPFVEQAREILRQRMAKEWSEQQQRPLEEVLADPNLARTLEETMASYVTATREGTTYFRFKLLNDTIGYTAGDQTIGLPHMILDQLGLSLLRQPGRMLRKLPAVLNELEREMNDPQRDNQVRVALTAVFSEMPTKQAVSQGIGRLFSDLQVASMAKQDRITTYHPTLRKPALVKQMEAAVKRLRNVLAEPDAQRRMVEEVEAAEKPQPRRFKTGSFFTLLFSLIVVTFLGATAPDLAAMEQPVPQTRQTDTELMVAASGTQATRSYGITLDDRSRQMDVPAEAGNRRILSYQTMQSPLGSHVALLLEKTPADIEQIKTAKTRALEKVQQQIDRLLGQEEPADIREVKMWRALASTLAALNPAAVQLQAAVVLQGRELGAYWADGITYLPARHLGEPEMLAYDLVHENLHPAIRAAFGQLGSQQEEALVLKSGVNAFGSMISVSLGFDNGQLGISVNSIDPELRMDSPEVERAIQGALLAAWRQVLEQRARGVRVDQDYANTLSREMERRGMAIPTSLRAKPGEGGFITGEAAGLLAGIAAAIAGIAGIAVTGTVTVLTGGLAAAGILVVLGIGVLVTRRPLQSLLARAKTAFNWTAISRLARRVADFIRGNPMIIVAVAAGLYALLNPQPAEGGTMMLAAGALGIAGINRETPIRDAYKIASRYTVERRMAKMISHLEGAGMAVAQIDSFDDLKKIYGADIAAFAYDKSLQIIQHFLGKRGSLFRYENLEGSFGYMAHNANEANLTSLFKEIQTYLFQSFNRRYRVVTLPNLALDSQGQPLPERDLGVRLTQLRTLVSQYGRGTVGVTKGDRIHIVYEISAQSDLQHALQVAGILDAKQPADNLAAMPFENEALVGLHQGFLYVPKLNVGIAAETVYDQALAELPGKVELRTLLPGEQIVSRMTKSAYYAARNQARAVGGAIVIAREFAPEAEPQAEAEAEEFELEPEMILFNFNLRNDQIFQRWFINTTNDVVEQSEDKLEAFDTLRQLYEANQEMIEQEEFDYLGHIFMQARRLIEEMRQMGHYALPEAERKFADITLLWESRYGETAMNQFFARRPELMPAMKALEEAIRPVEREQDLAKLRGILRSFIEEKDLQVMAPPGRVKHPFSILMNFLRYWNKAIKFMPDFTDLAFYHERNVRKVTDDVIGTMLVIPELQEMERAVNALIPYLEAQGLRIKTEEGKKIKGVNLTITTAADGTYRIQPKQDGYYDVKIKIAPTMEMPFGAEIKILPDFIDESATRPGYTLIKQAVLSEVNWTIAIGGPSGTGKLEAARTLAKGLKYQVIDIGLIYRGVYAAAAQFVAEGKADDLHSVYRRSIIRLTDDGVSVAFGRKNTSRTEVEVSREQAMAVEPKLNAEQTQQLNQVVQRVVTHFAKGGRLVVVGQDPFAYLPQADVKIYFDLSSEERQTKGTKSWEELPAPKDALNISSDIQKNPGGVVRLIEQMIADAILTRGLGKSPYARMRGRTGYQALSLRNTLVVAAVWIGILSLGLGLPVLPALGIGLLYPSAKIVAAARLLGAKYGFPGMLRHWGEPVGAYDPQLEKMVDPVTGQVLGEAEWPIAWHEGFSHAAVQRALRFMKIDLAALRPGTLRHTVIAGLAEFATHTLDTLTAPLAFARLKTGPRWDAVALSGVFLTSGFLLAASFFVALPAAVPLALAAVFAVAGLSVAWVRGALAPAAAAEIAAPGAPAVMDLAEGETNLTEVLDQVRTEQRLGVAAQPSAGVWRRLQVRIRESGIGRALNQLRGMPAGLKLLMLLPKPQTNAWAKAAVIGLSLAVWAGISLALVNSAGVNLAAGAIMLGLTALAPGHAFNLRLRTTAASPLAQAIANSPWMEQTALALNRSRDSVQVSLMLQELLGVLNEAKDDPQAREAVLEVLASLPAFSQRTATLQLADGSQSTHKLPAVLFEKPNLFLRLKRVFPVITIDNQPQDLPQPRQRRAVDSAA